MPWYRLKIWSKVENRYIMPGNAHFVRVMTEDPDNHTWTGETECQLTVILPEIATDEGPWVLEGPRPRKCPICRNRRSESSTASARAASRSPSGTATSTRRSASAAKDTAAPTPRRVASNR